MYNETVALKKTVLKTIVALRADKNRAAICFFLGLFVIISWSLVFCIMALKHCCLSAQTFFLEGEEKTRVQRESPRTQKGGNMQTAHRETFSLTRVWTGNPLIYHQFTVLPTTNNICHVTSSDSYSGTLCHPKTTGPSCYYSSVLSNLSHSTHT